MNTVPFRRSTTKSPAAHTAPLAKPYNPRGTSPPNHPFVPAPLTRLQAPITLRFPLHSPASRPHSPHHPAPLTRLQVLIIDHVRQRLGRLKKHVDGIM